MRQHRQLPKKTIRDSYLLLFPVCLFSKDFLQGPQAVQQRFIGHRALFLDPVGEKKSPLFRRTAGVVEDCDAQTLKLSLN
jgi:hypothetical protein